MVNLRQYSDFQNAGLTTPVNDNAGMFRKKVEQGESGVLLYGITPPRRDHAPDRIREITARRIERLQALDVDGLVLYDLQDESTRTPQARPFPYLPTIDAGSYSADYLGALDLTKILYKPVATETPESFTRWAAARNSPSSATVLVGAPSKNFPSTLKLSEAYKIRRQVAPDMLLGGVIIPERHALTGHEHLRLMEKSAAGCSFFVSQCVYNPQATRDFLSDYFYHCRDHGLKPSYLIFTLTVCGSVETLAFMKWLGISIPRWLENDLSHASDILHTSMNACHDIADGIIEYCEEKKIPFGFNIESVSIRKAEIEASVTLAHQIAGLLGRSKSIGAEED